LRQTTLDDFEENACPLCGRRFRSTKALNAHITKSHPEQPLEIYPGEGVSVEWRGDHVEVTIRVRKDLWNGIRLRAIRENTRPDRLVFRHLLDLAASAAEDSGRRACYIA